MISLAYMGSLLHINDAATTFSTDGLTTHRLRHCRQAGRTTGMISTLLTVAQLSLHERSGSSLNPMASPSRYGTYQTFLDCLWL